MGARAAEHTAIRKRFGAGTSTVLDLALRLADEHHVRVENARFEKRSSS